MKTATASSPSTAPRQPPAKQSQLHQQTESIRTQLENIILGQSDVITNVLIALLAEGHVLLIGVPGLGKTLLAQCLGQTLHLDVKRVQCTPDLMPSDILGSEILVRGSDAENPFRFVKGPIFSQLLMVDEVNRANPRTQSALLQAMEERCVTIAHTTYPLPQPFHVLATQNPLEHEGTYPLPEAQLDRFMLAIHMDFPAAEDEQRILCEAPQKKAKTLQPIMSQKDIIALQQHTHAVAVGTSLVRDIVQLVHHLRPKSSKNHDDPLLWGPGPRGAQALLATAKARAAMQGRIAPSFDDVRALAFPALNHRIGLSYAAIEQGLTPKTIIDNALKKV